VSTTGVAVEKLSHRKFAEIASRQEALQTIFSSRLGIFHHPIFHFFQKNRLFQQPQALSQVTGTGMKASSAKGGSSEETNLSY
jgi:hypothetical protein